MEKILEKKESPTFQTFLKEVEQKEKGEEKLRLILDFMRQLLSSEGPPPPFRDFWGAKELCLTLFKEKLNPRSRTLLWEEYTILSDEGRRIKKILDEQSSFAYEQIELAIQAIQRDLDHYSTRVEELPLIEIPPESLRLEKKKDQYGDLQRSLDFLNALGERLNGLRKELITTSMRIRQKNHLFEEMKKLGDQVFPMRKEKIQELSTLFVSDVEGFINDFNLEKGPFFPLKEEIKALQKFAKMITLSPQIFTQSREKLSQCWDQIKDKEEILREERAEKREKIEDQLGKVNEKIESLKKGCADASLSLQEADQIIATVLEEVKGLDLGKDEFKALRKKLFDAKHPLEAQAELERKKKKEEEELHQKQQREGYAALVTQLDEFLHQAEGLSLQTLAEKWESFIKGEKTLNVTGVQKAILTNRLDRILDHIQEKKWQSLLEDQPEELASSLRALLSERHKEKRKVKERLEEYRKLIGGSSLNLERSMLYQELISEEKLRLDAIETLLEEIEEKLFDLED